MKKVLDFVKKNKLFSIVLILCFLVLILGIVMIKVLIFPNYKDSKYGDRLDNIENVSISDSHVNEVLESLEMPQGLSYKSYRISGKIVNIYLDVSEVSDMVKDFANKFVSGFSDDELAYYDFQVFVTKDDECVLIGYKNKISDNLTWNYEGGE